MAQRRLRQFLMALPIALLVIVGMPTAAAAGPDHRTVKASDDCEQTSFDAAIGPGTCVGDGRTTFNDFIAQLVKNGPKPNRAAKNWAFSRTKTDIDPGGTITVENVGGEFHTFTPVAEFGGGCVDVLNQILGLTPVPECANFPALAGTTGIASGGTLMVTSPHYGVQKYQCLIHPWMHTTVTVER